MKINSIGATNLQGSCFGFVVRPITVICGKNARGKTTRLNAVNLALSGFVPGVAKKSNEVYERLASGNPLVIDMEMDDGPGISRKWSKSTTGAVTCVNNAAAKALEIPAVMIDPDEFFSMTASDRTRFLLEHCSSDLRTGKVAATAVANAKNIKVEINSEKTEEAIASLCEIINECAGKYADNKVLDFLSDLMETVRQQKTLADGNVKRLESTLQGLTQSTEQSMAPADAEARLAKARTALDAANAETTRLDTLLKELERQIHPMRATAARATDATSVEREIADLEEQRQDELAVEKPVDLEKFPRTMSDEDTARVSQLSDVIMEVKTKFEAVRPFEQAHQARQAHMTAIGNLSTTESNLRVIESGIREVEGERESASHAEICPTCHQSIRDLSAKLVAQLDEQLKSLRSKRDEAQSTVDAMRVENARTLVAMQEADQRLALWDQAQMSVNDAKSEIERIKSRVEQAAKTAWAAANSNFVNAQARASRLSTQIADLRARATDQSIAEAVAKLPAKEEELRQTREQYRVAAQQAINCKTDVRQAEEDHAKLLRARSQAADRAKVQEDLETTRASAEVAKLAVSMVQELGNTVAERAAIPLLDGCNSLCKGILDAPLRWRDGELGVERLSGFVMMRTMSGAERTLARCAVSLALASESPVKVAIIDEIGRLDAENKLRLIENLRTLIASGNLDHAFIVDTDPKFYFDYADDNLAVIEV